MAKFKNLDLKLNSGEKVVFGSSDQAHFTFTTISGYNTPSGVVPISPSDELVVSDPIAGERATAPYHLVRYDQLADAMSEVNPLDWQESVINFATAPSTASGVGARYVVADSGTSGDFVGHENEIATWNGTDWVFTTPNEGFTLRNEELNTFWTFDGVSWGLFAATVDHSALTGLDTDDHEQYILVDGSRGFTSTVSGVYPVSDSDLATKEYVDDVAALITGGGGVVTLSGAQTITGDKTFDNTLTTFLGDVFFDGINITMSGTTLNTQKSATFNFDSTSTINNAGETNYQSGSEINHESGSEENHLSGSVDNYQTGSTVTMSGTTFDVGAGTTMTFENNSNVVHEDGSTDTYQLGSELVHESGSNETHESGSNDTYNTGSTLTLNGTTTVASGTMEFGNGSEIVHENGSTETYENGSDTVHESGSNDTYLAGSNLTFSGSNVTYEGDTNIAVNSGTTTNYNDGSVTNFNEGSSVTFSGTTVFETETYFNDNIVMASGTTLTIGDMVITGTISGSFTDTNRRYGQEPVINGATSQAVVFADPFPDDSYTLVATLTNEVDSPPSIYSTIQGVKTSTGFTTYFSGVIDSANFVLEWIAFIGQQE